MLHVMVDVALGSYQRPVALIWHEPRSWYGGAMSRNAPGSRTVSTM